MKWFIQNSSKFSLQLKSRKTAAFREKKIAALFKKKIIRIQESVKQYAVLSGYYRSRVFTSGNTSDIFFNLNVKKR